MMIRVFPRRTKWTPTDDLSYIGYPPLFRPPEMPVRISVTFTWDIPLAQKLYMAWSAYYQDVQIGGPAFNDPGGEFIPDEGTRHSLASQAINKGVSERLIGEMLGHRTSASTRRYAKVRAEALKGVWGEDKIKTERGECI